MGLDDQSLYLQKHFSILRKTHMAQVQVVFEIYVLSLNQKKTNIEKYLLRQKLFEDVRGMTSPPPTLCLCWCWATCLTFHILCDNGGGECKNNNPSFWFFLPRGPVDQPGSSYPSWYCDQILSGETQTQANQSSKNHQTLSKQQHLSSKSYLNIVSAYQNNPNMI